MQLFKLVQYFCFLLVIVCVLTMQPSLALCDTHAHQSYDLLFDSSQDLQNHFNSFFKKLWIEQNPTANPNDVGRFLLGRPETGNSIYINNNKSLQACHFEQYWKEGRYKNDLLRIPFAQQELALQQYCHLQSSFSGLTTENLLPAIFVQDQDDGFDLKYSKALERLKSKDTLVIIIPGVFGEFIDQVAFSEAFNSSSPSKFSQAFDHHITVQGLKGNPNALAGQSHRFLIKNLSRIKSEQDDRSRLFDPISIDRWIKVTSIDKDGTPLFKLAALTLEPMSLESLGFQEELALLYIQRLNKFLEIYKAINNNKFPEQIIFLGYSRGANVALEMLTILQHGGRGASDRLDAIKNRLKEKSSAWSKHIHSLLSLGGVLYGSALADSSVIKREGAPFKVQVLQEVMQLVQELNLLTEEDLLNALKVPQIALRKDQQNFTPDKINEVQLSSKGKAQLEPVVSKLRSNLILWNRFADRVIEQAEKQKDLADEQKKFIENLQKLSKDIEAKVLMNQNKFDQTGLDLSSLQIYFDAVWSILKNYNVYMPDMMGIKELSLSSGKNFGLEDSGFRFLKATQQVDFIAQARELNQLLINLNYYLKASWAAIQELGTISRLNWFAVSGALLPDQDFTYYSIFGVLGLEPDSFYKEGLGFGYNHSTDQMILNQSWRDLQYTGTDDGLDITFSGSKLNDSQVDWHKTILWPHLTYSLTGKKFRSRILSGVRTHHWGMALPYAFKSASSELGTESDQDRMNIASYSYVNPFPRQLLLEAAIISIEYDQYVLEQEKAKQQAQQ